MRIPTTDPEESIYRDEARRDLLRWLRVPTLCLRPLVTPCEPVRDLENDGRCEALIHQIMSGQLEFVSRDSRQDITSLAIQPSSEAFGSTLGVAISRSMALLVGFALTMPSVSIRAILSSPLVRHSNPPAALQ